MKQFVLRQPIVFVLLITLLLEGLILGAFFGVKVFAPDTPLVALDLPILALNAIIAAIMLSLLEWWQETGFNRPSEWRHLRLLIFPVIALLIPAIAVGMELPAAAQIGPMVVVMLLIGFQEEAIYRGIMLKSLEPRGIMTAALVSALLFGVIHANSFLLGRDTFFVISQIVASFLGGFALAAIRFRTNTIWPLIVLHAVNDFIQFSVIGGLEATEVATFIPVAKIGISLVMFTYGMYLLRSEWLPQRNVTTELHTA